MVHIRNANIERKQLVEVNEGKAYDNTSCWPIQLSNAGIKKQ